jgi:dTDP-4-dehydrorhamnose reductase
MAIYDRILLTGSNGMLAHALIRALKLRNLNAITFTRSQLDITNASALKNAFSQHKPTLILNCAAHTKVDLCEQQEEQANSINGHAVGELASLAKHHGAKLVHYSTDFVFDGSSTRPYLPTDPTHPLSAYGRSKLLGEQKLLEIYQINPAD